MIRTLLATALLAAVSPGCSSSSSPPGSAPSATRSTTDPRVLSFLGRAPTEISPDVRWLNAPPASLAALRGRVVFLQFAFPT